MVIDRVVERDGKIFKGSGGIGGAASIDGLGNKRESFAGERYGGKLNWG